MRKICIGEKSVTCFEIGHRAVSVVGFVNSKPMTLNVEVGK